MSTGPEPAGAPFTLAIVAAVKNETAYIEEWLAYHTVVGVEHFFIYDNDSSDDVDGVLGRYINHGLVTLLRWPMDRGQVSAYRHAVHFFGPSTRWLALIDIDEFIVPRVDPDVPTILRRVDPEQLVLPWRMFGFSGHRTRPDGLVIENFTIAQDLPEGGLPFIAAKAIVKPATLVNTAVHLHRTRSGTIVDGRAVVADAGPVRVLAPNYDVVQLNHYYTKSEAEFAVKVERGPGSGSPQLDLFGIAEQDGYSTVDHAVDRFVGPTKRRMAELQALSAKPFRYGSLLAVPGVHYDPLTSHARRAISNYVHAVPRPVNSSQPVQDLGDRVRSCVVEIPDGIDGEALGSFIDSVHLHDFVRRLGASWVWRLDPSTMAGLVVTDSAWEISDGRLIVTPNARLARLSVAVGDSAERRHCAMIGVVEVAVPGWVTWSVSCAPPDDAPTASLPAPGRFVCVAQATAEAQRVQTVTMAIAPMRPIAPITLCDLAVVTYG